MEYHCRMGITAIRAIIITGLLSFTGAFTVSSCGTSLDDPVETITTEAEADISVAPTLPEATSSTDVDDSATTETTVPVGVEGLTFGDEGEAVRELQQKLDNRGFAPGPVDGIFGDSTAVAVRAFQDTVELPSHGIADDATLEALDSYPTTSVDDSSTTSVEATSTTEAE